MELGKVIGTVVSTSKNENLVGKKLLLVKELNEHLECTERITVAVDSVGAGTGEVVILCKGSAARVIEGSEKAPIDAAIVGIVDTAECV
jgi:ethanolamine utilization protein EutN